MRTRTLSVGDKIYDYRNLKEGYVISLDGETTATFNEKDKSKKIKVGNEPDSPTETWEVSLSLCYKYLPGKTYKGHPICEEHLKSIPYPLYCPEMNENCYDFELDETPEENNKKEEEKSKSAWIRTSEKTPENHQTVLTIHPLKQGDRKYVIADWWAELNCFIEPDFEYGFQSDIWMPLPKIED